MAIAETLALAGLRLIASPVMEKLINKGFSYVGMDAPSELKDLVGIYLPQIVIATRASEGTHIDMPELKAWLQRLKDTYDEAEDILDEVEYWTIAEKIKHEKRAFMVSITSLPLIKPLADFAVRKLNFLSSHKRKLGFRLNKLKNDVKDLVEVSNHLYTVRSQSNATPVGETSSVPQSTIFVGRDDKLKLIIDELLKDPVTYESKSYSVVAIVGIGGAGKTTLAQHIYKDDEVAKHFDTRMWVSLTRKMDVIKHTKAMIESATSGKECPQSSILDALQSILVELLSRSKRALIVLDDLWYKNNEDIRFSRNEDEDWERLLAPLNSTNGSKAILLTSRSQKLPGVLESETKFFVNLGVLTTDDSMSLFRHHACLNNMDESPLKNELEEIGVQIVEKLSRFPLAIKSVASQLRGKWDVNQWSDILQGSNLNELKTTLMWSYQQLDKELQRCFFFCSIFPKGYPLRKTFLVPMWLALNYIRSTDSKNDEDIGSKYFDELASRFFFQHQSGRQFVMHDAFHDLAESLTREECFRIEDEHVVEIPSTVHHLSCAVGNIKEHLPSICQLTRLRTLIFLHFLEEDSKESLDEILRKLKKLRILVLVLSPIITQLPKTVCKLKYIKYLDFCRSSITQVPEALSDMPLLCVLRLPVGVVGLPKSIVNLHNLRHVDVIDKENGKFGGLPPVRDIGKITSLQTLPEFHVRKEKGFELHQLGNLRALKGSLFIYGLENVSHKNEAVEAKTRDKNLDLLHFEWTEDLNGRNSDFETIQALQPPKYLKFLCIAGYSADRYPTWLEDESIRHVHWLRFDRCNVLEVLPSKLHQWRYCKKIVLNKLRNLKELPVFPLCLQKLSIHGCPSLVLISEQELVMPNQDVQSNNQPLLEKQFVLSKVASMLEAMHDWTEDIGYSQKMMHYDCAMFQQIGELTESDMPKEPKIQDYAQGTLSLCEDQLQAWWNCHIKRVKFIYSRVLETRKFDLPFSLTNLTFSYCNITDRGLSVFLRNLYSLQYLELEAIMSLVTLPLEETMLQLGRLRYLKIKSCWLLRSLGALHKLYLEKFEVNFCPCLQFENEEHDSALPSSLQWLKLRWCTISSGIFSCELPKLDYVYLEGCRSSTSLSIDKMTSVTDLTLSGFPDVWFLSGLHSLCLKKLHLTLLPKLKVKDHVQSWPSGAEELHTDKLEMLKIFSSRATIPLRTLILEFLQEETFTSEDLSLLNSLERLCFFRCKAIPTNFTNLSSLQVISFEYCPHISQLPELPKSIRIIEIKGCPVLKERCRHNGEDWPKIADINYKLIV
ncbi:Disease resistance protein (CC-NBS-LRR class) family [Rhynchospora pubera]|uniref:Disease resistance protein (CC-NBS-LRR class) family n=1 Tax=Rhynchospora pubera TaxID=906938 RepID=A0AAV8GLB8_9POAL|nr:Disease resistance protein (CC-NBS-LRR class) family [Rhynchospora pubera]